MTIEETQSFDALPVRRATVGDLEFHYVEEGAGTPLVFIHGLAGDYRTWAPQWSAFAAPGGAGYRCISYSRRFNAPNRNSKPSTNHSALVEAQDLAALLGTWHAQPSILVGSSYGAFIALAMALDTPELVKALVIVEPPMMGWADFVPRGRQVREAFDRDIRQPARAAFERDDDAEGIALLTGGIVGADAMARMTPSAMKRRLDNVLAAKALSLSSDEFPMLSPERVRLFSRPTLLLAGANTPPIHDVIYRALCSVMTQATQRRIPDAGHGVAKDNASAFNRCVLDFLANLEANETRP